MIRNSTLASVMMVCLISAGAVAEDVTVAQEDKAFAVKQVSIKAGDSVTFVNNDSVTHNVYSKSKGNKFDSGAQGPSASMTQVFATPGKVKVRCAIHPRMKLTVNVE